jgi:hypothetical protein
VPDLGYFYNALEPYIDALSMQFTTTNTTARMSKILIRHWRMLIRRFQQMPLDQTPGICEGLLERDELGSRR